MVFRTGWGSLIILSVREATPQLGASRGRALISHIDLPGGTKDDSGVLVGG